MYTPANFSPHFLISGGIPMRRWLPGPLVAAGVICAPRDFLAREDTTSVFWFEGRDCFHCLSAVSGQGYRGGHRIEPMTHLAWASRLVDLSKDLWRSCGVLETQAGRMGLPHSFC